MLSRHYAGGYGGAYDGPLRPYGIEMRQFGAESALFLLTEPRLVLVRTQVRAGPIILYPLYTLYAPL